MEKRTIFLELPAEIIDRVDRENVLGDRSAFISTLLERQLQSNITTMNTDNDLISRMEMQNTSEFTGELSLVNSEGITLGKFDINSEEGFENLAKRISEISDNPIVRMRAQHWR